jgi:hypothetical protein
MQWNRSATMTVVARLVTGKLRLSVESLLPSSYSYYYTQYVQDCNTIPNSATLAISNNNNVFLFSSSPPLLSANYYYY